MTEIRDMTEIRSLSVYFAERERAGDRFLADALLDTFTEHRIATSIIVRGIAGFGPRNIVRSDRSLSLSEDLPVLVCAVDTAEAITAVRQDAATLLVRGLIALHHPTSLHVATTETPVKMSVYLGRQQRLGRRPGYELVCDIAHRHRMASATAFLGVDGTAGGHRRRARFFSRNADVPMVVTAVGSAARTAAVAANVAELLGDPPITYQQLQICKQDGRLLGPPTRLPAGSSTFQKLTVFTTEDHHVDGLPVHRALIRRLHDDRHIGGATVLRGLWGFHGAHSPHGDTMLRLPRRVPVATTVIDTSAAISRAFAIADDLTADHGLVTCENLPEVWVKDAAGHRGSRPTRG